MPKNNKNSQIIEAPCELKYIQDYSVDAPIEYECSVEARQLFDNLPKLLMPITPFEYKWVFNGASYELKRHSEAKEHQIKVVIYGPKNGKINFITQIDGVTSQSFAHTRPKSYDAELRHYPMKPRKDYAVPNFDYEALGRTKYHMPGHCIDHADTLDVGELNSTNDARNYIPEPPKSYWGLYIRNPLVQAIRRRKNAYVQYPYYSQNPLKTFDGTPVPDGIFFSELATDVIKNTYRVPFTFNRNEFTNIKGLKFLPLFDSEVCSTPKPTLINNVISKSEHHLHLRQMAQNREAFISGNLANKGHSEIVKNFDQHLSEHECFSSNLKFQASIAASSINDSYRANRTLIRSIDHLEFLLNLDKRNTKLIAEQDYRQCLNLFKNSAPGFEDLDDARKDTLVKFVEDGLDYLKQIF